MKISIYTLIACVFTLAVAPTGAQAATIVVTANAPDVLDHSDNSCSLREAITNINNAADIFLDCVATGPYGTSDSINLPAGVYTNAIASTDDDANADGDLDILKSVTITGAGARTIIDGGGIDRVFHVRPYTVGDPFPSSILAFVVSDVTIRNGSTGHYGGGIFNDFYSKLTVTNCTISSNAGVGGGIYNRGDHAAVISSTISGNYISGIVNEKWYLTVTNSTISGNLGADFIGGGITNTMGVVTVTNSTITGNSADNGGGLANRNYGIMRVINSTITANTAVKLGGGIVSDFQGGYSSAPRTTIINTTISGNYSSLGGGGVSNSLGSSGKTAIYNSTITGNRINNVSWGGGGVLNVSLGHYYEIKNTIVANQVLGDDCAIGGIATFFGFVSNSLDSDGTCNAGMTANPLLGPLADNGGGTYTHALLAGSPAIERGNQAVCAGADVNNLDQRCVTRPKGRACDIGAFEKATSPLIDCPSTLTIGGDINGLASGNSLVLQNNAENLTVGSNGYFTFAHAEPFGHVYYVLVVTQPTNQVCNVANGTGTLSGTDNITNVHITCDYLDTDNDGIPDYWDGTPDVQNINACTGDHAVLQGTFVTGTQTSCRAALSVTTESSVIVQPNAILSIVSPQINVVSVFTAATGSMVWMVAQTPVEK